MNDKLRPGLIPTMLATAGASGVLLAFGYSHTHQVACVDDAGGYPGAGDTIVFGGAGFGVLLAVAALIGFIVARNRIPDHSWIGAAVSSTTAVVGVGVFGLALIRSAFACGFLF
jgi:hypothetical protein